MTQPSGHREVTAADQPPKVRPHGTDQISVRHPFDPKAILSYNETVLYCDNNGVMVIPLNFFETAKSHGFVEAIV